MILAVLYTVFVSNKGYLKAATKAGGLAPPEARLPPGMVGSVVLPIGLFWFAWTNYPSIHWIVSIIAGAPFGFGMASAAFPTARKTVFANTSIPTRSSSSSP